MRPRALLMLLALTPLFNGCTFNLFDQHGQIIQSGWNTEYVVDMDDTVALVHGLWQFGQQPVADFLAAQWNGAPWYVHAISPGFGGWMHNNATDLHNALHLAMEPPESCLWIQPSINYNFTSGFAGCFQHPNSSVRVLSQAKLGAQR